MPEDTRLTLTGIVKSYAAVKAIRHADFELQPGQVHALVGENGAGKSTLIKVISGAVAPDAGSITYNGEPGIDHLDPRCDQSRHLHRVPGATTVRRNDRRREHLPRP